jgi:hypothetical protein
MPKTKPWNTDLLLVRSDETLYTDYKCESKEEPCSVQLKTTRIERWLEAHRIKYNTEFCKKDHISVRWETKHNNCTSLRLCEKSKVRLVVSFYTTDGTILVQGDWFTKWAEFDYKDIMSNLDRSMDLCPPTEPEQDPVQSPENTTADDSIMEIK